MDAFFSIIIPVYNVAPYLRECLDSILSQTFTDWEAICVDDGSTDGSEEILDEYKTKDSRFKVVHQENSGVSAARNRALDEANGVWVLFLDADDLWSKYLLEYVKSGIDKYPLEKLFRFSYQLFEGEEWEGPSLLPQPDFVRVDISKSISYSDTLPLWQNVFSRRDLGDIRFQNYKRGEDRLFLTNVMTERAASIVVGTAVLYGYRKRAGSEMNTALSIRSLKDEISHRIEVLKMLEISNKTGDDTNWREAEEWIMIYGYHWIWNRNKEWHVLFDFWMGQLRQMLTMERISRLYKLLMRLCLLLPYKPCHEIFCYVIPKMVNGGSPIRYMRHLIDGFCIR